VEELHPAVFHFETFLVLGAAGAKLVEKESRGPFAYLAPFFCRGANNFVKNCYWYFDFQVVSPSENGV
jgi:hypothetical protein